MVGVHSTGRDCVIERPIIRPLMAVKAGRGPKCCLGQLPTQEQVLPSKNPEREGVVASAVLVIELVAVTRLGLRAAAV